MIMHIIIDKTESFTPLKTFVNFNNKSHKRAK